MLKGLIEVLHFKFLNGDPANISAQSFNRLVHLRNNGLILVVVVVVLGNNLIKVVFLNVDFHCQLLDFLLQAEVVVLFLIIGFSSITNLLLELCSLIEQMRAGILKVLRLGGESV